MGLSCTVISRVLIVLASVVLVNMMFATAAHADNVAVVAAAPGELHLSQVVEALSAEGVTASPVHGACAQVECLEDVARRHATDDALRYVVESGGTAGDVLHLWLADARGARGDARVPLDGAAPPAVVVQAYRAAKLAQRLGDRGVLRVASTPAGAAIHVDGEPAGHAPVALHMRAGAHEVAAELSGFATQTRQLQVLAGREQDVAMRLARLSTEESARPPAPSSGASALAPLLGGVLVAGAAIALWFSASALLDNGRCEARHGSGVCIDRAEFTVVDAVLLGAGVVGLGAGVYVFAARPLSGSATPVASAGWARVF